MKPMVTHTEVPDTHPDPEEHSVGVWRRASGL